MKSNHSQIFGLLSLLLIALGTSGCDKHDDSITETIEIFHTSDYHGNLLSEDLIEGGDAIGGLSRVASIVSSYRKSGSKVVLLEGGDVLQGDPSVYYANFVDTLSKHLAAQTLNFLEYDAMTPGNHDFETGHKVYDRFYREVSFPLIAANAVRDTLTHESYFKPYTVLQKGDKKIAVLGLTMPTLIENLPEHLYKGIYFEDQIETAKRILPEILAEKPDLFIALIHSGSGNPDPITPDMGTNVGYDLAREVPEIDIIFSGHDHTSNLDSVAHSDGTKTYLLNPGGKGRLLSHATVTFSTKGDSTTISLVPSLIDLTDYTADPSFVQTFTPQLNAVKKYVSESIGHISQTLDNKSALFRPNAFIDLIHQAQFNVFPEADISFTAPLSEDARIQEGELQRKDLFKLYSYENMLYLMRLTGDEIKGYLEESYSRYFYSMDSVTDPMLIINEKKRGGPYLPLREPIYNFDTAAGLNYTVDLSKPLGERVQISNVLKNDSLFTFSLDSSYLVVINSYRGSGGGGLLTAETGAAIPKDSLQSRVIKAEYRDMRQLLERFLRSNDPYNPRIISTWSLQPEVWTNVAIPRDSALLFADRKKK